MADDPFNGQALGQLLADGFEELASTLKDWQPYTEPPSDARTVTLRFDDDGSRDRGGFYRDGWYLSEQARAEGRAVHPVRWREIAADG